MDSASFSLILFSAMIHAGWNFFTKTSNANKIGVLWFGWVIAGLSMLPVALIVTNLNGISFRECAPYLLMTGIVHAIYLYLLGHSYSIGDMSVIYPISRGLGIVLTVIIALVFKIDNLSAYGMLGVFILATGILLVTIKRIRDLEKRAAMVAAAKVGICISIYSIIDKLSLQVMPPLLYISLMFLISAALLTPVMFYKLRAQSFAIIKNHKMKSSLIGLASFLTYTLVLLVLQHNQASYVVALRETSIVFGCIMGMWILKEESNKRKIIGIVMILIGAFVIKGA